MSLMVHVYPSVILHPSSPDTMFCITKQTCEHSLCVGNAMIMIMQNLHLMVEL